MQAEKLSVALRPRANFEAMDLGLRLAHRAARPLFLANLTLVLAVTAVSQLIFGWWLELPLIAILFVWWLKPLFDRLCLHVLSHAVFDATPSLRASLAALPRLLRQRGLIAALTWRRLDPLRSLRLPVEQLEGLTGRSARQRRKLLGQRVSGAAFAGMFCFLNFELILWVGLVGLVALLVPNGDELLPDLMQLLLEADPSRDLLSRLASAVSYAFIVGLLEPFFMASGFGLYLKRRTDLEAWDVELQLRRVRLGPQLAMLAGACVLSLVLLAPRPVSAQTPAATDARREEAARRAPQTIREILAEPDFGSERTERHLRWKKERAAQKKADETPGWLKSLAEFFRGVGKLASELGRGIVYVFLGIVALVLLRLLLRQLHLWRSRRGDPLPLATVAGLDIRPESLPADVASEARKLLAAGRQREALALLYRGALSRFAYRDRLAFERGDTEGDCLLRVTRARLPAQPFFFELTRGWQRVAYARQTLPGDEAESLCAHWIAQFGGAA